MIKNSDGDNFEEMRSMLQELTFEEAKVAFARYKLAFSEEKYTALGFWHRENDPYTNLACLVSDQCQHSIQDYPEEALREALLNAMIHRDYSFSGSIIINIHDFALEIISLGGLLPGLSPEDIRSGISQPRNRNLAALFHRLKLIESYGTGIRKIFSLYEACLVQPEIEVTPHTFKITLPNQNRTAPAPEEKAASLTPQMKMVVEYLEEYGEISEEELQELLNIKRTRAYLLTRQMSEAGILTVNGRGAAKRYRLQG